MTWRLFQAVLKPKATLRGKCHIVLDEDEQKRIAAPAKQIQSSYDDDDVPSSAHASAAHASAAHEVDVEDSDEEEQEPGLPVRQMSSAAPAAAAAASAPKKIVAKKK